MNNKILIANLFLFCLFFCQIVNAQNRAIQGAIDDALLQDRNGKYYVAKVAVKKMVEAEAVKEYCKDQYEVHNINTESKQIYGTVKEVVVSFEFRDLKELEAEKIEAEKRRIAAKKEAEEIEEKRKIAAKERGEKLAAAEELRKKIAAQEAQNKETNGTTLNSLDKFKNYEYQFDIISETSLSEVLYLKDDETNPFMLVTMYPNGIMYTSGIDDKAGSQKTTFDTYKAQKNEQDCFYLHGFNHNTGKEEHFLLQPFTSNQYVMTNLVMVPEMTLNMTKTTKNDFEQLLGTSDLASLYRQGEYPKFIKLSAGFWGQTKVELREDLYYIIDNQWDYSEDLSCYDKCHSCDFFGGKSDKEVDEKEISIYCQGKLLGEFSITDTYACGRRFYSHTGSNSLFGAAKYGSEMDAIAGLINSKQEECVSGDVFLTEQEKQEQIHLDIADQNYKNGRYKRVYPNDEDLELLKAMNISKNELTGSIWKLEDGQTYQFNADGTSIYKGDQEYIDLWKTIDDSSRIEIEMQPPIYDNFFNMTFVHCSIISIVKEGDKYFLYRADTPNGVGNCIKCPITKVNK